MWDLSNAFLGCQHVSLFQVTKCSGLNWCSLRNWFTMGTDHQDFRGRFVFPRSSVSRYLPSAATREAASWPAAVLPELIMKDGSLFKKKKNCLFLHGRKQKWSHFPVKLCVRVWDSWGRGRFLSSRSRRRLSKAAVTVNLNWNSFLHKICCRTKSLVACSCSTGKRGEVAQWGMLRVFQHR